MTLPNAATTLLVSQPPSPVTPSKIPNVSPFRVKTPFKRVQVEEVFDFKALDAAIPAIQAFAETVENREGCTHIQRSVHLLNDISATLLWLSPTEYRLYFHHKKNIIGQGALKKRIFSVNYNTKEACSRAIIKFHTSETDKVRKVKNEFKMALLRPNIEDGICPYYAFYERRTGKVEIIQPHFDMDGHKGVERGHFTRQNILVVAQQIAKGVAWIHTNGFVHRDIKAENILINAFDPEKAVLSDLDLVCDNGSEPILKVLGTLSYLPPEYITRALTQNLCTELEGWKEILSEKLDIWSYGCLLAVMWSSVSPSAMPTWFTSKEYVQADLYEMLAKMTMMNLIPERPEHLFGRPVGIPQDFINLIKSCLKTEPKDRPTIFEILSQLENMQKQAPKLPPPFPLLSSPKAKRVLEEAKVPPTKVPLH